MAKATPSPAPLLRLTSASDGKCILVNVNTISTIEPNGITLKDGRVIKTKETYEAILERLAAQGIGIVF